MYKKFLVIASKKDIAGINIINQLSQFQSQSNKFDIYTADESILQAENLDLMKINNYDFVIFASKHSSEKKEKSLCIHAPGNWNKAEHGGRDGKVCKSSALFQKQLFQKLKQRTEESKLRNYKITLECTHHGPLINKPCVFIEIGSTEIEWKDKRLGFIIAKTILESIEEFKENPYNEVAIGIGGLHYCPGFNQLQMLSNIAISHIIPHYAFPLTPEMIKEAWEKTEEEPDFVLLDWNGIGNAEERKKIIELLDRNYLPWKKNKNINR